MIMLTDTRSLDRIFNPMRYADSIMNTCSYRGTDTLVTISYVCKLRGWAINYVWYVILIDTQFNRNQTRGDANAFPSSLNYIYETAGKASLVKSKRHEISPSSQI